MKWIEVRLKVFWQNSSPVFPGCHCISLHSQHVGPATAQDAGLVRANLPACVYALQWFFRYFFMHLCLQCGR